MIEYIVSLLLEKYIHLKNFLLLIIHVFYLFFKVNDDNITQFEMEALHERILSVLGSVFKERGA